MNLDKVRILQYGEGNFLRAFVDWMMVPDSIVVVKPRPGKGLERLLQCNCKYNIRFQGISNGETIDNIESVNSIAGAVNPYEEYEKYLQLAQLPGLQLIVSNTTEAGIQYDSSCLFSDRPALSYPGKLTQFLYHRWKHFNGDPSKGIIILPCELIFHNGKELKRCIDQYINSWNLESGFSDWLSECCHVYNTLVDRIVPGGDDPSVVKAEPYHLWVIEASDEIKKSMPLRNLDFNILFTSDEQPYHQRKVTLLNGPHTALSAVGHLAGLETVRDCMVHPVVGSYVEKVMMQELLPTIQLPERELMEFAQNVKERFLNPYSHHLLKSIMLNNLAKYRTRDLPAIHWHMEHGNVLPKALTIALAANLICAGYGAEALSDLSIWGEDLTLIPGLNDAVKGYINRINNKGILSIL